MNLRMHPEIFRFPGQKIKNVMKMVNEKVRNFIVVCQLIDTASELVLRLYMQFADEIAILLAGDDSEQQLCEKAIIKTRAYRTAIERMLLAPYGSITLIETKTLQVLAQRVSREKLRKRADDLLAK